MESQFMIWVIIAVVAGSLIGVGVRRKRKGDPVLNLRPGVAEHIVLDGAIVGFVTWGVCARWRCLGVWRTGSCWGRSPFLPWILVSASGLAVPHEMRQPHHRAYCRPAMQHPSMRKEATRRVVEWDRSCRVVAMTTYSTEGRALEVLRAGACGYLVKNSTPEQIIDAVVAAHDGDRVVSAEVQEQFVRAGLGVIEWSRGEVSELSDRERQIVGLIAGGLSNAEIADVLCFSEGTVKGGIRRINQLWGVENRLQIVLRATELGLVSL